MSIGFFLATLSTFFLASSLVRRIFRTDSVLFLMTLGAVLCLAFIEIAVGILGRLFPWEYSFLAWGGGVLAALLILLRRPKNDLPPLKFSPQLSGWNALYFLFFFTSTFLIAMVAFRYSLSDESGLQGHLSVIESILRGDFPPKFLSFPDIPYRYHYGFNLLAAVLSRTLNLPGFLGVDILTVVLWILSLGTLTIFLTTIGVSRRFLTLSLIFIIFSGGWSWWLATAEPGGYGEAYQNPHWQLMYLHHRFLHLHLVVYFFQHPVSLGIPLFLASLLCFHKWMEERRAAFLVLTAILLGALSLAHIVFFLTALAAYALVFLVNFFLPSIDKRTNFKYGLFLGTVSLALAFALGGFFRISPDLEAQPLIFSWPPGYLRHEFWGSRHPIAWRETLQWYFSSFGWLLLLLPYALYRSMRSSCATFRFLGVFCILGLLVPQFFRYVHTWDVIKWFLLFEFSGRILVVWAYLPWLQKRKGLEILAWLIVLSGMVSPLRFLADLAFKAQEEFRGGERRYARSVQPKVPEEWGSLLEKMRSCRECRGRIWSSPGTSAFLAIHTGYPVLPLDANTLHMGISKSRLEERRNALAALEKAPSLDLIRDLKIRWIAFSCAEWNKLNQAQLLFFETLGKIPGVENHSVRRNSRQCFFAFHLPEFISPPPGERLEDGRGGP